MQVCSRRDFLGVMLINESIFKIQSDKSDVFMTISHSRVMSMLTPALYPTFKKALHSGQASQVAMACGFTKLCCTMMNNFHALMEITILATCRNAYLF